MAATAVAVPRNIVHDEESEEDKELQAELKLLVDKISGNDLLVIPASIDMMKFLIKTSTTSMTSVPKPLKYLAPNYELLKMTHQRISNPQIKKSLADIISVLAMGTAGGEEAKNNRDCLKYCLQGTMEKIGDWGHEYIRQLEKEIVQQWTFNCEKSCKSMMPLIHDIMTFNSTHNAEIQGCDLLTEIDLLHILPKYMDKSNYKRICLYLSQCAKYADDVERCKIMKLVYEQYMAFGEHSKAIIAAIQINKSDLVNKVFVECQDKVTLCQLAFICSRQCYNVDLDPKCKYYDELIEILGNSHLNTYFLSLARELDIMEPKSPDDVYKTWLEPVPPRFVLLGESLDSARKNLASSFVNGFVNAGFGSDKLITIDGGNKWIYRNKDRAMISATASLGLLHLWDVDGGLTPIDKYLYSTDENIKAGALLALGIVNCRVKNECDPALALLGDYVNSDNGTLQCLALIGIALAYAGTHREDIIEMLLPLVSSIKCVEALSAACLALGFISIGKSNNAIPSTIINRIIEMNKEDSFKTCHMRMVGLGLALCYFGARDEIEVSTEALNILEEPFRSTLQTILLMCAYAGTGDVLIIQELLHLVGEKGDSPKNENAASNEKKDKKDKWSTSKTKGSKPKEWDYSISQAMACLAVAAVGAGESIGVEMVHRIFGQFARYGESTVRAAVPLAMALSSVSNPQLNIIDVLTKYSHDSDEDVAVNAIFGLGIIGAGTNHARLAATLRQLAAYHHKRPSELFMVRVAQGLVHMGKGTLTLDPLHTDRMLVDPVAMAGLLSVMIALLDPQSLVSRSSYYIYFLSAAIQPRWLLTLDEDLRTVPVSVRVGQAVDVVGKAGTPKTIAGIHTHTTPVLLATAERAELATEDYQIVAPTLDGICVLRKIEKA
ncbi:unnamed protein product [Diabrotica balteata]|uniref:26S proteasome non-ATPase regulatory subunit 2 n=1 Tax=Diabrotica balteata TaxID=107213 RepID=A0A9N9SNY0_DIABA|nr:unnamed protein product [Diabrotica balteata]